MTGQAIAHYRITAKLGEGGMGEVYRATDTRLGRDVAIKLLPQALAGDADCLERFKREATVLASLNHPNVATIHGIEEAETTKALVLELVEGDTLADRLKRGPLPVEQSLRAFKQIADAVESAHRLGIIHRDLKPANIKFTADGQIKVLDFGLAKAVRGVANELDSTVVPGATSKNATQPFTTQPGMLIGTPTYMSPEQSRGEEVDKQTDIWSFGCCLFEALAGRKPFQGDTLSDVLAEILKSDPDFSMLPAETPPEVVSLVRRCLEKEPGRRLRDMGDIAIRLEEALESSRRTASIPASKHPDASQPSPPGSLFQNAYLWMGFFFVAIAIAFKLGGGSGRPADSQPKTSRPSTSATAQDAIGIRSLAILPFDDLAQDSEFAWLTDAMPDAVRNKLAGLPDLALRRGHVSLKQFMRQGDSTAADLANRLNVDALVQGNFVHHDGSLQVNVSLIHAATGREEPLGLFTKKVADVFALQGEVAVAIATGISSGLSEEARKKLTSSENIDPQAYIAFREGLTRLDSFTSTGFGSAISLFEKSIELDSDYLAPRIQLAYVHWLPMIWGTSLGTAQEGFARADKVLADARAAFPEERFIDYVQGYFDMLSKFDWAGAKRAFDKGLRESPEHDQLHGMRCWYLLFVESRYQEALRTIDRALELDPDRTLHKDARAEVFAFMDNDEEALRLNRQILVENPDGFDWLCNIALNLKNLGRAAEGLKEAEQAVKASERSLSALAIIAELHAALDDRNETDKLLSEIHRRQREGEFVPGVWEARVHAELGDHDKAVELLTQCFENREGNAFLYHMRKTDLMRMLADHPGYWELVDRMKYPQLPVDHPFHDKELQMRFAKKP